MTRPQDFAVCDLLDENESSCQVLAPALRSFGGHDRFAGPIETVRVFEDNPKVKATLASPGNGRVLVVDGGGSTRCALMGDLLGDSAVANGWAGVVIHGCVRDTEALGRLPLGVLALAPMPRKSVKRGEGQVGEPISFLGVDFEPGSWLYADPDGVIVAPGPLHAP
ncbi:MAG: ribonuclease E activity regulator RraA [Pseudomonadota bacterium]